MPLARSLITTVKTELRGRRLTDTELDAYDVLSPELAKRARIFRIRWLPSDYLGITLGHRIFLATDVAPDGKSPLLAHELVHVRQWHELGIVGFSMGYVSDFGRGLQANRRWKAAYSQIGAEVEARLATEAWLRRHLQFGRQAADDNQE